MGALLRTEHVSGREGAATCSQFWRASEAASLICNVLCSPLLFFSASDPRGWERTLLIPRNCSMPGLLQQEVVGCPAKVPLK